MTVLERRPGPAVAAERSRPANGGQLPSLTGLRWAAAILVFLHHVRNFEYFGAGKAQKLVDWAFYPGFTGVSFFFILSGFVLIWSARDGDGPLVFWRRRIGRVYPVHLVTAVIALVLAFTLIPALKPTSPAEGVANLLLVSSWKLHWWQALNPVSWSLVCEAFFYALFPLLFWVLRGLSTRELTVLAGLALAAVYLVPWVQVHQGLGVSVLSFPLARVPEFVLGAAMGRLVKLGAWHGPGLDIAVALTAVGYFLTEHLPVAYGYAACTVLGYGLLVPAAAIADLNGTPSIWRHRWLVRLGEWSFAFYMIHLLVMLTGQALFGVNPRLPVAEAVAAMAAALLISLGLAWALYRLVEVPGRRLIVGRSRRPAAPPPRIQAEA